MTCLYIQIDASTPKIGFRFLVSYKCLRMLYSYTLSSVVLFLLFLDVLLKGM